MSMLVVYYCILGLFVLVCLILQLIFVVCTSAIHDKSIHAEAH